MLHYIAILYIQHIHYITYTLYNNMLTRLIHKLDSSLGKEDNRICHTTPICLNAHALEILTSI